MKFLIILNSNIKRMLKNKKSIIPSFLLPSLLILVLAFIFTKVGNTENVSAIIVSDNGTYGQEFVNEMKNSTGIKVYEKQDAIEKVKKKVLSVAYEIPENFTELIEKGEKPKIISYKIDNTIEPGNFEFYTNSIIGKMLLRAEFKNNGNDISLTNLSYEGSNITVTGQDKKGMGDTMVLNMIISFALFGAIGISTELSQLKTQNTLKRSFTTSNKPHTIIGAILAALFIISSVIFSGVFLLASLLFSPSNLKNAPIIVLNIVFIVLVALSLGVFITRLIKNDNLIPVILQIIISLTCFAGGSFMPYELLPKSITMFSKFTPQYWALQSINTENVGMSLVVLLFSAVLFTAGTFKTKSFV